jgi:GNAT superfamily N-acetyltransferase
MLSRFHLALNVCDRRPTVKNGLPLNFSRPPLSIARERSRAMSVIDIIRQATPPDTGAVSDILWEAARWLDQGGRPMWRDDELSPSHIAEDIQAGLFFLAECERDAAGTIKFQLEDALFWPDVPPTQSAFVHRLAVRRRFAGGAVSSALLEWAVLRTRSLGRRFLRLDCEESRPRLRQVYERFGFRHHSDRQVGPYFVARYEYDVANK